MTKSLWKSIKKISRMEIRKEKKNMKTGIYTQNKSNFCDTLLRKTESNHFKT